MASSACGGSKPASAACDACDAEQRLSLVGDLLQVVGAHWFVQRSGKLSFE